jgi:folate-dependent phosphoribosylglycinamide formyltransferase PurN
MERLNEMNIAVFAYNFPHKKTNDFILRLFLEGFQIRLVIASDPVELNLPKPTLRVKPRYVNQLHPLSVCERLNIPYHVLPHNSPEAAEMLRSNRIDVGVISGARILKRQTIQAVAKGILNFHPGWIPEVRGLDALKWAIYRQLPIAVTAHLIDERVDAGRVVLRTEIPLYRDDSFVDLSLRLDETQVDLLPQALRLVEEKDIAEFSLVTGVGRGNGPMPEEMEKELPQKLQERLSRLSK